MSVFFHVFHSDPNIARLIADVLGVAGYVAEIVDSPEHMLETARRGRAGVIIAGDSPVAGGRLVDNLLMQNQHVPVVLITDSSDPAEHEKYLVQGVFFVIRVPIEKALLIAVAHRALESVRCAERQARLVSAIRDRNAMFRAMVDGCDMPAVVLGADLEIMEANEAAKSFFGKPAAQVSGMKYPEVLPPDMADSHMKAIRRVRETREKVVFEESRRGDYFEVAMKPVERGGELVGFTMLFTDKTAWKLSEQELVESEQRYRSVYEAARDAILLVGREDGRILDCNEAALNLYGYAEDAICNLTLADVSAESESIMRYLSAGLETLPLLHHRGESGREFPVEVSLTYFMLRGKQVATAFIRDISNRKVVEEALREGARLYRAVVEDQTELICRFDTECRLTFANPAYAKFFGSGDEDELLGTSFLGPVVLEDRENVRDWMSSATPENPVMALEQRNLRHDGEIRWMRWINRAIYDHRGALTGYQAVGRDVSDRKHADNALLVANEEKERLRLNLEATFRSIPDGIITVDSDMKIIATNSAVTPICSMDRSRVVGRPVSSVMACGENPCTSVLKQVLETREPVRGYEVECTLGGDRERMMELNCSPLIDENKKFSGAVLVIKDISRIADLEKRLQERHGFRGIVGKSEAIQDVYQLLEQLAPLDSTVLICGESGTGKELVAEALHYGGARSGRQIVKVNCSALSESLLESELFGHVRGAFTGAVRDKKGRIETAQGGTLFLDEIGDISPLLQLKLLRFLELKEYERVGESKTRKADVRIIAATNVDLKRKVREGFFREDLYYRLNVMPVNLPPLREREGDIPLLVDHFLQIFGQEFKKAFVGVSDEVMNLFMRYPWPGNIRELKHILEHACILCADGVIGIRHVRSDLVNGVKQRTPAPTFRPHGGARTGKDEILSALDRAGGNKAKAAKLLGIHRATLYRKMARLGISA